MPDETGGGQASVGAGAEDALARAEHRYAQAKARLQALRARQATRERKLDTRRKILLGGALLELAAQDDDARALVDRLVEALPRERDRKAFEGWRRPGADRGIGPGRLGARQS